MMREKNCWSLLSIKLLRAVTASAVAYRVFKSKGTRKDKYWDFYLNVRTNFGIYSEKVR
jgi:hypothetical protein